MQCISKRETLFELEIGSVKIMWKSDIDLRLYVAPELAGKSNVFLYSPTDSLHLPISLSNHSRIK